MYLTVNGEAHQAPDDSDLVALVTGLGLRPGSVVVEHNGVALLRSELAATPLHDGDRIELVRAVAGG